MILSILSVYLKKNKQLSDIIQFSFSIFFLHCPSSFLFFPFESWKKTVLGATVYHIVPQNCAFKSTIKNTGSAKTQPNWWSEGKVSNRIAIKNEMREKKQHKTMIAWVVDYLWFTGTDSQWWCQRIIWYISYNVTIRMAGEANNFKKFSMRRENIHFLIS